MENQCPWDMDKDRVFNVRSLQNGEPLKGNKKDGCIRALYDKALKHIGILAYSGHGTAYGYGWQPLKYHDL
jgi:hypothetical protein